MCLKNVANISALESPSSQWDTGLLMNVSERATTSAFHYYTFFLDISSFFDFYLMLSYVIKSLFACPERSTDRWRGRDQEARLISCQSHCRIHQATSPEEDLKPGKERDLDDFGRKCRKTEGQGDKKGSDACKQLPADTFVWPCSVPGQHSLSQLLIKLGSDSFPG